MKKQDFHLKVRDWVARSDGDGNDVPMPVPSSEDVAKGPASVAKRDPAQDWTQALLAGLPTADDQEIFGLLAETIDWTEPEADPLAPPVAFSVNPHATYLPPGEYPPEIPPADPIQVRRQVERLFAQLRAMEEEEKHPGDDHVE